MISFWVTEKWAGQACSKICLWSGLWSLHLPLHCPALPCIALPLPWWACNLPQRVFSTPPQPSLWTLSNLFYPILIRTATLALWIHILRGVGRNCLALPCIALHYHALPAYPRNSSQPHHSPPRGPFSNLFYICNSYAATFAVWLHIDWGGWEELPCIVLPSDLTFCFDDPALPMDPLLPLLCNFDAATFMLWLHILRRIESSVQAEPSYKRCNPAL